MAKALDAIAKVMRAWLFDRCKRTGEFTLQELHEGVDGAEGVPPGIQIATATFMLSFHEARQLLLNEDGIGLISISPRGPLSRRPAHAKRQAYRVATDEQMYARSARQGRKAHNALGRRVALLRSIDPERLTGVHSAHYHLTKQKAEQLQGLAKLMEKHGPAEVDPSRLAAPPPKTAWQSRGTRFAAPVPAEVDDK